MTVRNLNSLFKPRSLALIGASATPNSVGHTLLRNLTEGGFKGEIFLVNPKYQALAGRQVYARVAELPAAPELAVICTPAPTIPGLIAELGAKGAKAAIVISAGLGALFGEEGTIRQAMLKAAKPYLLRILGPNCVGLLVPGIGLNASFAHTDSLPGQLAFISQSGALVTGVLDWAKSRGIGFSKFISVGDSADIDFGDLLDYLAGDYETRAILLYVEDIRHARKFMSAARAAGRSKPVVVVKAGRAPEGAKAAASHTGALAGADEVYDAAIRRAGMLRVLDTEDLFDAVEALARSKPLTGRRLMIMTNGGGLGVLATDALIEGGGRLARLSEDTLAELDQFLPLTWSHGNPVDIIGDAPAERYRNTLEALLRAPYSDAILFIHAPTAIVPSAEIAVATVDLLQKADRNVLSCWLGGDSVARARHIFSSAGIPTYGTPEEAVRTFLRIAQYRRNQELLMQAPPSLASESAPDRVRAQALIQAALEEGREMLSEPDSRALLQAYGIPVAVSRLAATVEEAVLAARGIGFPVALKIHSPDIIHKSDVGGVALDLESEQALRLAAEAMLRRVGELKPCARLQGFAVQQMVRRPDAHELIVGIATDAVFGPVILFGQGGIAVEVMADRAVALPPLNMVLAHDLLSRTRVFKLLAGYRNRPAADKDAICRVLLQVAQLAADLPAVLEMDINPLLADAGGVIALDARVRIVRPVPGMAGAERLAIRPYPQELEQCIFWQGGPLMLRPIRPEDAAAHTEFFNALDPEDVRSRMFFRIRELQPPQLARLTQIDYDREMAFIASREKAGGGFETLGVARAIADPDNIEAEFAVVVRSDLKGKRLGWILMQKLIDYCRNRGLQYLFGEALAYNRDIQKLVSRLGFTITRQRDPDSDTVLLRLELASAPLAADMPPCE